MKILILGSSGMAGHVVYNVLKDNHEVYGISRSTHSGINSTSIDIHNDLHSLEFFIYNWKPEVIINCVGVLVQDSELLPTRAIFLNSLLPHELVRMGKNIDAKVIHISTDCVFNGNSGPYKETDIPTETNWYGRTKALGEIRDDKNLTIRTSIIGPELKDGTGLFHWFMIQGGEVTGFSKVLWNGVTTLELAKQINNILKVKPTLSGLYHLTPKFFISKYELLKLIAKIWGKDIKIKINSKQICHKVLENNRLREYNPNIPDYETQLTELYNMRGLI